MKEYKAVSPLDTISKIKEILSNIGILSKEEYIDNENFYSCRVNIGNSRISPLKIGTNGKGASFEYSLASGYAEFMERLQNNMLLFAKRFATKDFISSEELPQKYINRLKEESLLFDYLYDREERLMSIEEVVNKYGESIRLLFNFDTLQELSIYLHKRFDQNKCICVPFYSVLEDIVIYAPIGLFLTTTGSNGMASGNTAIEAILQGLCEIFERYAISSIHNESLTPPTIPFDFFKGRPVYDKLKYLEEKFNYKLIIKDCSLNKGLPVIGVIIIDTNKQRYNFKLASDFVPEFALERCLNELYQGVRYFKSVPFKLYTLTEISELNGNNSLHINLERIFVNGSGYWPMSIFSNDFSYDFFPYEITLGKSNEIDLKYSIDLIRELDFNIYIRDNSFFGFPTYYIVIPGMSQIISDRKADSESSFYDKIQKIRYLGNINEHIAKELSQFIHDNYHLINLRDKNYSKHYIYTTDPDLLDLELELLMFMLCFYVNNYTQALLYLSLFLKDKDTYVFQYYYAVYDFVDMYFVKQSDTILIREILDKKYNVELCAELFSDFSNPKMVFQYYDFPDGLDLSFKEYSETCALFPILRIEKAIEKYSQSINQENLRGVFNP